MKEVIYLRFDPVWLQIIHFLCQVTLNTTYSIIEMIIQVKSGICMCLVFSLGFECRYHYNDVHIHITMLPEYVCDYLHSYFACSMLHNRFAECSCTSLIDIWPSRILPKNKPKNVCVFSFHPTQNEISMDRALSRPAAVRCFSLGCFEA